MLGAVTYSTFASRLGQLLVVANGSRLCGLYIENQKWGKTPAATWNRDDRGLENVANQLDAYFAGRLKSFDLQLSLSGTKFQCSVWQVLCEIPFGRTVSYAHVARRIGSPQAVRAVGAAVGRNPVSIIVPCHRVVGSDGRLTGYAAGLDRKEWLLKHEGGSISMAPSRPPANSSCRGLSRARAVALRA